MAEPIQVEPHSVAVEDYRDSFFSHPPTDLRFESTKYHKFYPSNALKDTEPINLVVPRWNGRSTWGGFTLLTRMKICKKDGSAPDNDQVAAPINNIASSLYKDQKTWLNGVNITPNSGDHAYKSFMEVNLTYDTQSKNGFLQAAGFYKDTPLHMDKIDSSNMGFFERLDLFCTAVPEKDGPKPESLKTRDWTTEGRWFVGGLRTDFNHPIPNGVDIRFELTPQDSDFFMMTTPDSHLTYKIMNVVLLAKAQTLQAPIYESIEQRCKTEDMNIPFKRKEIKIITLPKGTKAFTTDQLFAGNSSTPSRMIVGFVEEKARLGHVGKNPFNFMNKFGNSELMYLKASLNGEDVDGFNHEDCPELNFFKLQTVLGMTDGATNGLFLENFLSGKKHAHSAQQPRKTFI